MAEDNRYPQIAFRAGTLLPAILARSASEKDRHATAQRWLAEYLALLGLGRRELALSENEALLICDALNGIHLEPVTIRLLPLEVEDAIRLDGLDEKWSVDGPGLAARLKALSPAGVFALADGVRQFWAATGRGVIDRAQMLTESGLIRKFQSPARDSVG